MHSLAINCINEQNLLLFYRLLKNWIEKVAIGWKYAEVPLEIGFRTPDWLFQSQKWGFPIQNQGFGPLKWGFGGLPPKWGGYPPKKGGVWTPQGSQRPDSPWFGAAGPPKLGEISTNWGETPPNGRFFNSNWPRVIKNWTPIGPSPRFVCKPVPIGCYFR